MGNPLSGPISNSVIVMNSVVEKSSLQIINNYSSAVDSALKELAKYAADHGSADAQDRVAALSEELAKKNPKKGVLRDIWSGITKELPSISSAVTSVAEIVKVFAPQ